MYKKLIKLKMNTRKNILTKIRSNQIFRNFLRPLLKPEMLKKLIKFNKELRNRFNNQNNDYDDFKKIEISLKIRNDYKEY